MAYYYFAIRLQGATTAADCIEIIRQAANIPTLTREEFTKLFNQSVRKISELREVPESLQR